MRFAGKHGKTTHSVSCLLANGTFSSRLNICRCCHVSLTYIYIYISISISHIHLPTSLTHDPSDKNHQHNHELPPQRIPPDLRGPCACLLLRPKLAKKSIKTGAKAVLGGRVSQVGRETHRWEGIGMAPWPILARYPWNSGTYFLQIVFYLHYYPFTHVKWLTLPCYSVLSWHINPVTTGAFCNWPPHLDELA